jgi:hypothetical protein
MHSYLNRNSYCYHEASLEFCPGCLELTEPDNLRKHHQDQAQLADPQLSFCDLESGPARNRNLVSILVRHLVRDRNVDAAMSADVVVVQPVKLE